jgi:hypothetical protein
MKDIKIVEKGSGGDFYIIDNDLVLIDSFKNQVYLSFFGGNINDDKEGTYWANDLIGIESQYISKFETALLNEALTSNGIHKLKKAAESDLEYMKEYGDLIIKISMITSTSITIFVELKSNNTGNQNTSLTYDYTKKIITWQD